jgi:hypothetical protein
MSMTSLLVENFVSAITPEQITSVVMKGGVKEIQKAPLGSTKFFILLIIFIIIILIKSYIVYLGYNFIVPRLMYSLAQEKRMTLEEIQQKFRPITFTEAIVLTIFANTLFSA